MDSYRDVILDSGATEPNDNNPSPCATESQARAYPGLILERGKIKKKNQGGQNPFFFAQKYQIFSKIDLFFRKIGPSGGAVAPLPSLGTPLIAGLILRERGSFHQEKKIARYTAKKYTDACCCDFAT